MKATVYLFPALMLAFIVFLVLREAREATRRHRLGCHIAQLSLPTTRHLLTEQDFKERRR